MKTAIVTGAYGVIGREISRGLVSANFHTILLGRNQTKLSQLKDELKASIKDVSVEFHPVDLSSKNEIFSLAERIGRPVAVLINNAATAPRTRTLNKDGIEMQWATNVLSYFWMIKAFESHLKEAGRSRIVNVASYWAGGLNLDDPEFKTRPYHNDQAYRQSKQANRMMTYGLAYLYKGEISVNACHPGDANSKLSNELGFGGSQSAIQSAQTPLFLATDPEIANESGAYFANCAKANCQFKNDREGIDSLLELCCSY